MNICYPDLRTERLLQAQRQPPALLAIPSVTSHHGLLAHPFRRLHHFRQLRRLWNLYLRTKPGSPALWLGPLWEYRSAQQ
jgi:hypothetical protein